MKIEEYLALAGSHYEKGELHKANVLLLKGMAEYPATAAFYYNLGLINLRLGKFSEASQNFKETITLSPFFEQAHQSLGSIYLATNQTGLAVVVFENLLKINPKNDDALYNLGLAYYESGRYLAASKCFRQIVKIRPNHVMANCYLGLTYKKLEKLVAAKKALEKALKLDPGLPEAILPMYKISREVCNWERADEYETKLNALTVNCLKGTGDAIEMPFTNIIRIDDLSMNLEVAKFYSKYLQGTLGLKKPLYLFPRARYSGKKVTIGYLSDNFFDHPVVSQIADLFVYHDKKKFNIYVYNYGPAEDTPLFRLVKKHATRFFQLDHMPHRQIADKIYSDAANVLVDLMGYTGAQSPDIVAYKPAPIQISYLGYPGTMGASYIDYLIADEVVIPRARRKYYSEKIIYMPNCYQMCSPQKISTKKFRRQDCGLPEIGVVLASFNRPVKIEKPIFDIWLRILTEIPGSVLWIYAEEKLTRNQLKRYVADKNIDPSRLIFAKKMLLGEHLSRLALADIVLDTHIYSGGATTANALWAGVPVVTVKGKHYLSRMSASILTNFGLDELVARDLKQYEALILKLAQSAQQRTRLKKLIQKNKKSSTLFDAKLFTKHYEDGIINVRESYLRTVR